MDLRDTGSCILCRAIGAECVQHFSDSFHSLHSFHSFPRLSTNNHLAYCIQCESKIPPEDLWRFFQNGWEFFNQILRAYYAFLSTLDYKSLFNYLQLWRSYAILSVTNQFTPCAQNVHHQPKRIFWHFPKQLGIFSLNFIRLLNIHTYARLLIFVHLSPTVTKLCHIKYDHPACVSVDGVEHITVVALNMA